MEADAHAAAAQDARSQNMFGRANAQAMQEKQSRMEAFRAEADANATTVGLQIQYLGAKAQLPLQTIKLQKNLLLLERKYAKLIKSQSLKCKNYMSLLALIRDLQSFFKLKKKPLI